MTPIEQCMAEQKLCAEYLIANANNPDADTRGAKQGLSDWYDEEIILTEREDCGYGDIVLNHAEEILREGREMGDRLRYRHFLDSKRIECAPSGFTCGTLNPMMMPFQSAVTRWGLKRGKAAIFSDCGTGKTFMELEWAREVSWHTLQPVLIVAPLAVAEQTAHEEGPKFGIAVNVCETQSDVRQGINITNYEKMHHFRPQGLGGIILDESSILKAFDGATRKALTEFASTIHYRLACTATPSPNDYMELGNHAEFLGIMRHVEMLSLFFCHDGGETSKWRLKGHAEQAFWKWMCSWAVAIRKPSDLGYDDGAFVLPKLNMHQITVVSETPAEGYLFPVEAATLQERNSARRNSIAERVAECAKLINESDEQWIVWTNLNDESKAVAKAIPDAIEVTGSHKNDYKIEALRGFIHGEHRVLVSKPSICGLGLNMQHSRNMAFVGLSDSYEQLYQAIRRQLRFGQTQEVNCYIVTADTEGAVVRNIERKEKQAAEMMDSMVEHMKTEMQREIRGLERESAVYETAIEVGEDNRWIAHLGDSCEIIKGIPSNEIGYTIFSPPFQSLYTYSNSDRDMGNSKTDDEFYQHYRFLASEMYRITKPGRLLSFHCMQLPMSKERDGVIGLNDFRGKLIKIHEAAGFVLHSEVTIWKDPVTAMQRTKALGLLHKQVRKDSCMSRQGIADYLITMRKPGKNEQPVAGMFDCYIGLEGPKKSDNPCIICGGSGKVTSTMLDDYGTIYDCLCTRSDAATRYSIEVWQRYASPVWMDIDPSDTLQKESAREEEDERHICPLQLQVIERGLELWSNPGDTIYSPFMGIGSEGFVALRSGRRFIGSELKRSYWEQAVKNLRHAATIKQESLFDLVKQDDPAESVEWPIAT